MFVTFIKLKNTTNKNRYMETLIAIKQILRSVIKKVEKHNITKLADFYILHLIWSQNLSTFQKIYYFGELPGK